MSNTPAKPKLSSPTALPPPAVGREEFSKQTVERLQMIQSQLTSTPRTGKLKGKVCVITGVGSIKGIGRVAHIVRWLRELTCSSLIAEQLRFCSPTKASDHIFSTVPPTHIEEIKVPVIFI